MFLKAVFIGGKNTFYKFIYVIAKYYYRNYLGSTLKPFNFVEI